MNREKMEKEGWKPASISGGSHLERIIGMYKELGFEVCLEEMTPEECTGCTSCYVAENETIYRIYTRAKEEAA